MSSISPASRAKRVFQEIDEDEEIKKKPEAFVLANAIEPHLDASFFYVTGVPYGLFEGSVLYANRSGEVILFTSALEEEIARSHTKGIEIYADADQNKMHSRIRNRVGKVSSIGINSKELTYGSYTTLKKIFRGSNVVDAGNAFENARLVKDDVEVNLIQKACDIVSEIYRKIPSMLKTGVTESEVAAQMAYEMQRAGGSGVSFDSIVAFGKNSAEPHYSAGHAKLAKGEFALFDYGTKYMRYCSDITRTLVFGNASNEQKEMYEVVKEAQRVGREHCTIDYTGAQVHARVSEVIDSTKYKGKFIHGTGHSLGLLVHDGPGLSKTYDKKLKPGMVVTVEPGVYIPGIGGVRIEDDVLITNSKPRILTSATRELIEVG